MKPIKLYMSHAIRGIKGPAATGADMKANTFAAIRATRVMRAWLHPLPVEIYCPAEHEFPPVGLLLKKGYITTKQILDVDCQIVRDCDGLVWYSALGPSGGAEIEMYHARKYDIPIFEMLNLNESYLIQLEKFVERLCQND